MGGEDLQSAVEGGAHIHRLPVRDAVDLLGPAVDRLAGDSGGVGDLSDGDAREACLGGDLAEAVLGSGGGLGGAGEGLEGGGLGVVVELRHRVVGAHVGLLSGEAPGPCAWGPGVWGGVSGRGERRAG